jgi:L-fuconolactonase
MLVIDAQVHIWGAETPEWPWAPSGAALAHRPTPLEKDELLREMDAAGIDRAIIVPPSWEGDRNDLALEAVLVHPDRFAVMGRLAIERPESRSLVNTWKCQSGVLGVRLTFHRGAYRTWLTDGTAHWFWAAAEHAGLAVIVFASGLLPHIATVAARHQGLRLVLDHLALSSDIKDAALGPAFKPALALAQYPNVAVKAASLPSYVTDAYPYPSLHAHIRRVVEAYGPHWVFGGTDLPRLRGSYRQAVPLFTEELDFLSDIDKTWMMDRGIAEWLGWPL